jgi:hypothetical protein
MIGVATIVGGYALLIWQFGWAGAMVSLLHLMVLAAGARRG